MPDLPVNAEITLEDDPGAVVQLLGSLGEENRAGLNRVLLFGEDRVRGEAIAYLVGGRTPSIPYVFPDGLSIRNRGFRNDSFIYTSAAFPLLSVAAVPDVGRDEFSASPLKVDWVVFSIARCSFLDGLQ